MTVFVTASTRFSQVILASGEYTQQSFYTLFCTHLGQAAIVEARVGHADKEDPSNVAVFTEMSNEGSRRSIISMKLWDLNQRCVTNLLSFTASIKIYLSLVLVRNTSLF